MASFDRRLVPGILSSVEWYIRTDVSGQSTNPISKELLSLEDGTDGLPRKVCKKNYHSTLTKILKAFSFTSRQKQSKLGYEYIQQFKTFTNSIDFTKL